MSSAQHHRTIWLSDIHLGSRACRIDLLLDFLKHNDSDTLYLVGDIVDLERMRRSVYWPTSHTRALQLIIEKSRRGTRVVYIPGNHDDELRSLAGTRMGNIEIALNAIHETKTGRRLLVLHGDEFDGLLKTGSWKLLVGSMAYGALLGANRLMHWYHELLGRPYWSLAQHVKGKLGEAMRHVTAFRRACLIAAANENVDGIVCGHIHRADIAEMGGLTYYNDGDWVESCSALIEDRVGTLSLCRWTAVTAPAGVYEVGIRDAA
jgi:UDP-2,3-diacylglucosamine pyrophosphatase LpxH